MKAVSVGVVALALLAAAPAQAAVPSDQQRQVWQHVCESAGGELQSQPALVCERDYSQFSSAQRNRLQRVCEDALGGSAEYRSEYPVDLVGCFFS